MFSVTPRKVYTIMVRGEHLLIRIDRRMQFCGFFTTRIVRANNVDDAANLVLSSVRKEIRRYVITQAPQAHALYVEEAAELDCREGWQNPGRGFIWFQEETD